MKINIDTKKGKEAFSKVLQKTSDAGKKAVADIQQGAKDFSDKQKQDAYQKRLEIYNPFFMEEYENDNFVIHDSSLYSSDMKRLLSVPQYYGEPGYHTYEVASTVEVIDNFAFNYSIRISKVVLPVSLKSIGAGLFVNSAVSEIEYLGTVSEWENVSKGGIVEGTETEWNLLCNVREVKCSDANYEIPQEPVEDLA